MRASTQYSNSQRRGQKPAAAGDVPVGELPQQELVIKHADLVKRIAYHLVSRMPPNVEVDDLIQSGMIGLLDAAKHYSPTKGANFETYAGIRIRGAMLDEVRKSDWTPRSVHRNMREMADVVRKIENAKGQDATPLDIAEGLGVSIEDYHKLVQDAAIRWGPATMMSRVPRRTRATSAPARSIISRTPGSGTRSPPRSARCPSARSWCCRSTMTRT
jgi:RNA polymerase sigma factor for flagellar operon FliA